MKSYVVCFFSQAGEKHYFLKASSIEDAQKKTEARLKELGVTSSYLFQEISELDVWVESYGKDGVIL